MSPVASRITVHGAREVRRGALRPAPPTARRAHGTAAQRARRPPENLLAHTNRQHSQLGLTGHSTQAVALTHSAQRAAATERDAR